MKSKIILYSNFLNRLVPVLISFALLNLPLLSQTDEQKRHPGYPEFIRHYKSYEEADKKSDYQLAISEAEKALELSKEIFGPKGKTTAVIYDRLGILINKTGDFDRAIELFQKALSIYIKIYGKEHEYAATIYINIGEAYRSKGDFNRAIEYHQSALSIFIKKLGKEHQYVATSYNYMGGAYKSKGDYNRSIEYYEKALSIYFKELGKEHSYVATTYINLGGAHESNGNYDRAIEYYKKALPIYIKTLGKEHHFVATLYNNLGLAYYKVGNEQAVGHYKKALDIYMKTLGKEHPYIAITFINLGLAHRSKGNYHNAIKYYQDAIKIFKMSGDRDGCIKAMFQLADLHEEKSSIDRASKMFERAISLILKYRLEIGRGKSGFISRYIYIFNRLIELELKRNHFQKAFIVDSMKRGLSIAEDISLKDALIRGGVPEKEQRLFLSTINKIEELQSSRSVLINAGKTEKANLALKEIWKIEKKKDILDKGLSEKYSAYASLRSPRVPSVNDIRSKLQIGEILVSYSFTGNQCLAYLISKEKGLEVIFLDKDKKSPSIISTYVRNLHTLLKHPIEGSHYKKIITTEDNLVLWNDKTERERYEVRGNEVYRLIKKSSVSANNGLNDGKSLFVKEKIGLITGEMDSSKALKYREILYSKIYSMLLNPVFKRIKRAKRLIIIPDGPLYYLQFGLLKDNTGKMLYETHPYVLAHSSIVWYGLRKTGAKHTRYPLLAMGNAVYKDGHESTVRKARRGVKRSSGKNCRSEITKMHAERVSEYTLKRLGFSNLPGTAEEVVNISRIVYKKRNNQRKHSLLGIDASEDILFNLMNNGSLREYRILHFAVHGLFVDAKPALNALVLSQPDIVKKDKKQKYEGYVKKHGEMRRDGFLRMGEIKTLGLNADLVVMSACETSLGLEMGGEGMVGLPQAFLIGGSRAVIASLWPVDDEATCILMEELYKNIFQKKMKPDEALRKAQLSMREEYEDPFYWGAFVIYGR